MPLCRRLYCGMVQCVCLVDPVLLTNTDFTIIFINWVGWPYLVPTLHMAREMTLPTNFCFYRNWMIILWYWTLHILKNVYINIIVHVKVDKKKHLPSSGSCTNYNEKHIQRLNLFTLYLRNIFFYHNSIHLHTLMIINNKIVVHS